MFEERFSGGQFVLVHVFFLFYSDSHFFQKALKSNHPVCLQH